MRELEDGVTCRYVIYNSVIYGDVGFKNKNKNNVQQTNSSEDC